LVLEVVVLVVGLESLHEVRLLGILPLEFTTGMGGVVTLRRRGGTFHGPSFVVLVLLQAERVGFLMVVTVVVFVEVVLVGMMAWFLLTPLSSKSLVPVVTRRYITFGDNGHGRVLSEGEIKVSDKITLRRVALVQSLGYNLLSVSQLLDEGFEVLFQPGGSRILDSRGDLVCMVVLEGQVFRADFSQSSGVERCFLAGASSELWRWHRKLGHLSFDLLSCLSKLNLVRGLPRLRLKKELVCAPCRHAKMVASFHPPLTDVMT
jgi:hypothetical protein